MKSVTTERFRKQYEQLPERIKKVAVESYEIWKENPKHPSLQFKKIHSKKFIYSVRITLGWRALGVLENNVMIWFWIGSHDEYEKMIDALR